MSCCLLERCLYSGISSAVMYINVITLLPCCRTFDWDGDARWNFHKRSLEIPDPKMLQRAQARFYKRTIVRFHQ